MWRGVVRAIGGHAPRRHLHDSWRPADVLRPLDGLGAAHAYYDIHALDADRVARLPGPIRVLLESAVRNLDGRTITAGAVETILDWPRAHRAGLEVPFLPSRVLLQDFTGVPVVVDLAAMRDAVARLGGDPRRVNPRVPVDLVVDHSIQVDAFGATDAAAANEALEFQRNRERFAFLKWGATAFRNFRIVPPGVGIVHQVNCEHLSRVVFAEPADDGLLQVCYPDSVVGTDSHTPMVSGMSVLAWGVGGLEAEAVMLAQPISMVLPRVLGLRVIGRLPDAVTATDLVLTLTRLLRSRDDVVGSFVELFGPGLEHLSVADRATVSNMSPETGATCLLFPFDGNTEAYLRATGRPDALLARATAYHRAARLYPTAEMPADYSDVVELDLAQIRPSVAGPKRPHDHVWLTNVPQSFRESLRAPVAERGFGLDDVAVKSVVDVSIHSAGDMAPHDASTATTRAGDMTPNDASTTTHTNTITKLTHGSIVIAAITSCTNTSNPAVMLAAGLIAQNAVTRGLRVPAHVKTSLAPGSQVVMAYLRAAQLLAPLEALGFYLVGYGCTTCIGNSGPLVPEVEAALRDRPDLVAAAVLSGNRNFEGRIHAQVQANYLASPPLVVAYAIAGRIDIDWETEPLGPDPGGRPVYLRDIWPTREAIERNLRFVAAADFVRIYGHVARGAGSDAWRQLSVPEATIAYPWDPASTYIHCPPYFDRMAPDDSAAARIAGVQNARCLLRLGDNITTDHISPAGAILPRSPAADFLKALGLAQRDWNTYGARRGNDQVMVRGTFANHRLRNLLLADGAQGAKTVHFPSGATLSVFDAAERYRAERTPLIVIAGKQYGSGSSRDWAAKGVSLLGVRVVLAESYERIHRANLVQFGVIPLQFCAGDTAASLGIDGTEIFSLELPEDLRPGMQVTLQLGDGRRIDTLLRFDTETEIDYVKNGGVLQYVIRQIVAAHPGSRNQDGSGV